MVGAAWNHLAKKSVPKIVLLSRLALENTNLRMYHLRWLTINYQRFFCRYEQRTSNCTQNINFVVKIFDKSFWSLEEINIWKFFWKTNKKDSEIWRNKRFSSAKSKVTGRRHIKEFGLFGSGGLRTAFHKSLLKS